MAFSVGNACWWYTKPETTGRIYVELKLVCSMNGGILWLTSFNCYKLQNYESVVYAVLEKNASTLFRPYIFRMYTYQDNLNYIV